MALYPPIVASAMPAFAGSEVRIYFTLSNYNSINEIAQVHATVKRQTSNVNVLNADSEVKAYSLEKEQIKEDGKVLNRYYITIRNDDIINGFEVNVLYKVQLRLSSISDTSSSGANDFFANNIDFFSEWSTVCIIKKINAPKFYIDEFTTQQEKDNLAVADAMDQSFNNYYNNLADFNIVYESIYTKDKAKVQSQTLNKYKVQLFDAQGNLLVDSGDILASAYNYTNNTNSLVISCSLPYQFTNETDYQVKVTIETRNGYVESKTYDFKTQFEEYDPLNAIMRAAVNEEEGYIKLSTVIKESGYVGNLVIRRADSKGNFLNWRDIKHYIGTGLVNQTIEYYDFTVESGVFYKYLIQKRDIRGRRGTPVYATYLSTDGRKQVPGIMGEWEYAFLLQSNNGNLEETKQLKLKFDFQLSSYKYNVLESKTDTLGSKYPFIKRNGSSYYRSFGCSGTITGFMDQSNLFTSKEELYNGYKELYDNFKGEIDNYTTTYDYTYERIFREKVEEFLYNDKPKLYKSMQEGNMIIKLMDISLSPKNELGRLIYSFSATAYEIDKSDIQSLINYNFIKPGVYDTQLRTYTDTLGRLTGYKDKTSYQDLDNPNLYKFQAGLNILGTSSGGKDVDKASAAGSIAQKIKYQQSFNGKIVNDFKIDWIRITIEDDPYLIIKRNGTYQPLEPNSIPANYKPSIDPVRNIEDSILYFFKEKPKESQIYIGTLMYLNNQPIIISPPNNIYEITDMILTPKDSIKFAKDTTAIIDYHITYSNIVDSNLTPSKVRLDRINGYLQGTFEDTDIIKTLKMKYRFSNLDNRLQNEQKAEKYLQGVKSILIDTQPGVIISILTNKMEQDAQNKGVEAQPSNFSVGFTGQLNVDFIQEQDVYITSYVIHKKDNKPAEALVYYCGTVRREYY